MEEKIIARVHVFTFKSTTVSGEKAKFHVKVYVGKHNIIKISKLFLDVRGNLPFAVLKKFKKYWLYREEISLKEQTLIDILANSLGIIYPEHFAKITMEAKV